MLTATPMIKFYGCFIGCVELGCFWGKGMANTEQERISRSWEFRESNESWKRLRVLALSRDDGECGKESTKFDVYGRECSLQNARGHNRVTVLVLTLLNVRTRRIRQRLLSCPFDPPAISIGCIV